MYLILFTGKHSSPLSLAPVLPVFPFPFHCSHPHHVFFNSFYVSYPTVCPTVRPLLSGFLSLPVCSLICMKIFYILFVTNGAICRQLEFPSGTVCFSLFTVLCFFNCLLYFYRHYYLTLYIFYYLSELFLGSDICKYFAYLVNTYSFSC